MIEELTEDELDEWAEYVARFGETLNEMGIARSPHLLLPLICLATSAATIMGMPPPFYRDICANSFRIVEGSQVWPVQVAGDAPSWDSSIAMLLAALHASKLDPTRPEGLFAALMTAAKLARDLGIPRPVWLDTIERMIHHVSLAAESSDPS